ncbi:MAG TPA: energy transducer TonB [Tenuifilaceae bacterium]|nr:energy transducer TonB [Tenuifilaceae bacterium]HPE19402.1 energy transducer TonB [Tenuifilaceae bacterium]HPJ47051.1 energy transducer TonB [Tenuifilaceae bacterium]HPQ35558.1 energy transducer TonB [Tenuifilaceae bacterium]HRX69186.1 energy transducer TonB [Tenuifilaceae bacterium]
MELKKNPKADLEKMKLIFTEVGLVFALGVVLLAFEWTSSGDINTELAKIDEVVMEEEMIPITEQQEVKPPPPPPEPVQVTDVINIVEDDVEIDDNIDIFDSEFREDVAVQIVNFTEEEEEVEEEEVFVVVEDMPGFGGGDSNKFREYIAKNLRYPEVAAENGIQGRVFVQFVVEPDGRVSNVKVVRGVDPALDKEAIRVVESSPKWKPGKQRGKPVRVSFTFPIIFVLQ